MKRKPEKLPQKVAAGIVVFVYNLPMLLFLSASLSFSVYPSKQDSEYRGNKPIYINLQCRFK
jgi:hypothetical protein